MSNQSNNRIRSGNATQRQVTSPGKCRVKEQNKMTKIESLTKLLEPQAQVIREAYTRWKASLPAIDHIEACLDVIEHCSVHGYEVYFPSDFTGPAFIITERKEVNP